MKYNKLIILHGLNNNAQAFGPLKEAFTARGWSVQFLALPCHGENREEARNLKEAFSIFDQGFSKLTEEPYSVLAFSHGAVYLQLWLKKYPNKAPLSQVLLAPALMIHKQEILDKMFSFLPAILKLKSFSPPKFRKYQSLNVWEYRILLEGMNTWKKHDSGFKAPTLVLIDPRDELVDAQKMSLELRGNVEVKFWERNYLKHRPGRHHILFHPDYFEVTEWQRFINEIEGFFKRALTP